MIKVGIVGGSGYTGVELLRLLSRHPHAEISIVTSRSEAGKPITEYYPHFRKSLDLRFQDPDQCDLSTCDLVFFATPHGMAMNMVPSLVKQGVRVIDLSADFRIQDQQVWESWYHQPHSAPELLSSAVYGLPEFNRKTIKTAQLVANPGCYPTATLLGFLPLIAAQKVDLQSLIADVKSGVSGAGRKAVIPQLFAEVSENFRAYGVSNHRHWPEIYQGIQMFGCGSKNIDLLFSPHLVPMIRGIHATLYARLVDHGSDLQALYQERYANEPFVDVLPLGSHPETGSVRNTNLCRIALHQPNKGHRVVILSVIDNLVKGAAGQAIQNMNIMFGYDERTGLEEVSVFP